MKNTKLWCLLALLSLPHTAQAELTRSQIIDRNELRLLSSDLDRMSKEIKEEEAAEDKCNYDATRIKFSVKDESGGGTTYSIPVSVSCKNGKGRSSFEINETYSKEANNGLVAKEGLEDLSLKFTKDNVLPDVSYSLGAAIPMNQVGIDTGNQSLGVGYKYPPLVINSILKVIGKATHYNSTNPGISHWGKSLALQMKWQTSEPPSYTVSLSRKNQAGSNGLTKLDLGYAYAYSKELSFEFGYSQFLSGKTGNSLMLSASKAFLK